MLPLLGLITGTDAFRALQNDFKNGGYSHAYLVTCPDALFLKYFFRYAAAAALCPGGGCFECICCRKAREDKHADVLVYPREKDALTKAEISEITADCFMLPVESKIKIYVLNNFDKTAPQMQNKLLKTLEEPPAGTVFFLGASNESAVLPTIRSRCAKLALDQADSGSVVEYLCDKGISRDDARIAAAVSFSRPLAAESYAANKSFFSMFDDVLDVVKSLDTSRGALEAVSRLGAYRERPAELTDMLLAVFREALIFSAEPGLLLLVNKKNDIMTITEKFSFTALTKSVEYINGAKAKLDAKCNFNAVLDGLVLSILEVKYRCPK